MKTLYLTIGTLLLSLWLPAAGAAPEIGQPAPAFSATTTAGETVALGDYRGKTVILEWTNHLCPFVQKHYGSGNMQALQRAYTDEGVVWLSVISSAPGKQGHVSPEKADQLTVSRNAAPTHVLLDESGDIGRAYEAKTTPHMYIIDEQGVLKYMGAIDSIRSADPDDIARADNYVKLAMAELEAGEPVSDPITRAYGCTVKY